MTEAARPPIGVLFVCYANMCRSPLAEGLFRHLAQERGVEHLFDIDSAGTSAFAGAPPHPLSIEVAGEHGITLTGVSRQLVRTDLGAFDHLLLMDRLNRSDLRRMAGPMVLAPDSPFRARVRLLREIVDPEAEEDELDVADPVQGGIEDYERCFELLHRGCEALLDELTG
jgi:protein-tyrosine phosphatase